MKKNSILKWVTVTILSVFTLALTGILIVFSVSDTKIFTVTENTGTVAQHEEYLLHTINNINIETDNVDIYFKESQSAEMITVDYINEDVDGITISEEGGELNIIQTGNDDFNIFDYSFEIDFDVFPFVITPKNTVINVYLPSNYSKNIDINGSSCDVFFEQDIDCNTIDIKTESGDIQLKNIAANVLNVELSSGDLVGQTIDATKTNISASSGDIDIQELKGDSIVGVSSGDLEISSIKGITSLEADSGDIIIGEVNGACDIQLTSGDVSINSISGSFNIVSTSGNIDLGIGTIENDCKINASSGDCQIKITDESSFIFNGTSSSGDIVSEITGNSFSGDNITQDIGTNPTYEVAVETSSGDITLS